MSYDLFLADRARTGVTDWATFEAWADAEEQRMEAAGDDLGFYQPTEGELAALDAVQEAVEAESAGDVGLDIGYEAPGMVGVNLAYWDTAIPHLESVVERLNAFAAAMSGDQLWVDPQHGAVSSALSPASVRDVFNDMAPRGLPKPPVPLWRRGADVAIFCFIAWATYTFLIAKEPEGCLEFEDEVMPGYCGLPCKAGETPEMCDKRAEQLRRDAGADSDPVVPGN